MDHNVRPRLVADGHDRAQGPDEGHLPNSSHKRTHKFRGPSCAEALIGPVRFVGESDLELELAGVVDAQNTDVDVGEVVAGAILAEEEVLQLAA